MGNHKSDPNKARTSFNRAVAIQQEKIFQITDTTARIKYIFEHYPVKHSIQNLANLVHFARCGMTLYISSTDAYMAGGVVGRKLPVLGGGLNYVTPEFLDNYVGRLSKNYHLKFEKIGTQERYSLYKLVVYVSG